MAVDAKKNLAKGARSVYERSGEYKCQGCFEKKLALETLQEKVKNLQCEVKRLRGGAENNSIPIGAHTPPSQLSFKKKNSSEENRRKRGGAQTAHIGTGRKPIRVEDANAVVSIPAPSRCLECGSNALLAHSNRARSVLDSADTKVVKTLYDIQRSKCCKCGKISETKPPVFSRGLYGNRLLSQVAVMHYVHGIPIGRICESLGGDIKPAGLFAALHRLGARWEPILEKLTEEFKQSAVKHADETGWRIDGQPGWAWIFCTPKVSIFECQDTRGARIPKRIFGTEALPGVLVVDRLSSYNKVPCSIQYCYAHLVREVKKVDSEFPDCVEVNTFCADFAHLLSEAMRLSSRTLSDEEYYLKAQELASQIKTLAYHPHQHAGVKSIQQIFQSKEARLYHWVLDRRVPAHNNRAEREIRQTVIARKVSFGSQSSRGAKTRSTLMSVLLTAKKRLAGSSPELEVWFASALDKLALNPALKPAAVFPENST